MFLLEVFPWSLELGLRLVLFSVTRFQSSIPRQREPCLVLVGSNAVVVMAVDLLGYLPMTMEVTLRSAHLFLIF